MMNGEMERIWLATANGELRSEVLALKQELACWDVVFEMVPKRDSDLGRLKYAVVAGEIERLQAAIDNFLAMPEMQEIKEFISRMANGPSAAMRGRRLLKVWGLSDSVIDWALDEEIHRG